MDRERLPLLRLPQRGSAVRTPGAFVPRFAAIALALLFSPVTATAGEETPPAGVDFLYIESNVGTASGGHVALRTDDDVFHYQHDAEGFIALARDDWTRFRVAYNDCDNRNIHVARMPFGAADAERIRDHFVRRYLVQRAQLDFLNALRRDVAWLQDFEAGRLPGIEGAGLFRASPNASEEFGTLRRQIAERFGEHYLSRARRALEGQLASLSYASPDVSELAVDPVRFTAYPETFSAAYRNLAARLAVLRVLSGAWSLDDGALLAPSSDDDPVHGAGLRPSERARLSELVRRFEQSSLSLLTSQRADGGFSLLLALARLGAAYRSLAQERLLLVNPFHGLELETLPEGGARTTSLLAMTRARQRFETARRDYFALDELDEASLNVLENAAARYDYLRREVRTGERRAFPPERVVPAAARPVVAATPRRTAAAGTPLADAAEQPYRAFRDKVRRAYGYNLIGRNCATELMRALIAALPGDGRTLRAAGAPRDPEADFAFIPFRLYDVIGARVDVDSRSLLPSYRNRALAAFSAREHPLWIHLAEAATATSALYQHHRGDTLFLFFTEDWPWLRPVLGMANLGYGLVNAVGGVFTAVVDEGERLDEGLRGALFSLPELVFFNIRKGSFDPARVPRVVEVKSPS